MVRSTRATMDVDGGHVVGAMAAVLGNDNLLHHILVHVGYPTSLLCAALVCKQWLRHVSAPDFICRFSGRYFLGCHSRLVLQRLRRRCVAEEEDDDENELLGSVDDRWGVLKKVTGSHC